MRVRRIAAAVVVGALMGAPATAYAVDGNYTPDDPSSPTLAGSLVTSACESDEPWIDYRVQITAAEGREITGEAVLAFEFGARTFSVPLGELEDGALRGRVAWPADPGTVGPVTNATVSVPSAGIAPLAVPLAVPQCASAVVAVAALPATGLGAWVLPLGGVGALLVAVGVAVGLVRRSRTH